MYLNRLFVAAAIQLFSVAVAAAQPAAHATAPPAAANIATASRATEAPTIDGDVLGDPAWAQATPITTFWQEQPNEGQPASERTEVRVVFTADTLYIGAVLYDPDPSGIIVSDARRDAPMDDTDSFQMIVDTYRDRQNGFVFGTNPAGIEYDGQVTNEGQGGGGLGFGQMQSGGSGSGFNINWDGAWTVRAKIAEHGWSAEFAIPFRTLRYPSATAQTWGINFQRNIRRRNERAYWAPIPRQFNLYRLSLAGSIGGVQTPALRNFRITPYGLGNAAGVRRRAGRRRDRLRFRRRPEVQHHAEPDARRHHQHRLRAGRSRRSAGQPRSLHAVLPGEASVLPRERRLLQRRQSRRSRSVLQPPHRHRRRRRGDPDHGRRPRLGQGRQVQRRPAEHADLRLRGHRRQHELQRGARQPRPAEPIVDRRASSPTAQATGDLAGDNEYGRTFGLDGKIGIGMTTMVSGFVAKTETPGVDDSDHAFNLRSQTNRPQWDLNVGYQEVGSGFNPAIGFLSRRGYRKPDVVADDALPSEGLHQHPGAAPALRRSAASGASTGSRKPASCISTTTGSSATAPRSTPA